jgi:hypothetical protein
MIINPGKEKSTFTVPLILIFALSIILRIWFNFFDNHINTAFSCDAAEYLRDAQSLSLCLNKLLVEHCQNGLICLKVLSGEGQNNDVETVKELLAPLKEMSISGPAFPIFLLGCYKVCGQDPSMNNWIIPIFAQCALCALTCVLIACIGSICWGKKEGIAAGLLAALYPSFIVNSGRLYSESFACFLLCVVLLLLCLFFVKNKNTIAWGFLLGITLFALQVTRSLMSLLTIFTVAFFVILSMLVVGKRIQFAKYLSGAVVGFVLCLLPWLALQKLALGKTSLVVDRCGNYNLFVGNHVSDQGYLSIPYPDLSGVNAAKSSQIVKQSIKKNPVGWLRLMLDKPARLLKLPWNDFKVWLGPLNPGVQTVFHQMLLVLACLGIVLSKESPGDMLKRQKFLLRGMVLFSFILHFAYLAFITVPRYNLTAMPGVILFAGVGLISIFGAIKSKQTLLLSVKLFAAVMVVMLVSRLKLVQWLSFQNSNFILTDCLLLGDILIRSAAIYLLVLVMWNIVISTGNRQRRILAFILLLFLGIFSVPAYCFPLRGQGRWYEWCHKLKTGERGIGRKIFLNYDQSKRVVRNGAYLAVYMSGGERLASDWQISINGIKLNGPFLPAMSVTQDLSLVRINPANEMTIEQEWIVNHLCELADTKILDLRQWFLIPITADQWQKILKDNINQENGNATSVRITVDNCANNGGIVYGAYPFSKRYTLMPSLFHYSWEKCFYGVENDYSINDPAYDQSLSSPSSYGPYVKLLLPPSNDLISSAEVKSVTNSFEGSSTILSFKGISLPKARGGYRLIRLFGETNKQIDSPIISSVSLDFISSEKNGSCKKYVYRPVWTTSSLPIPNRVGVPRKFDFCFPILLDAIPAQLKEVTLHFDTEAQAVANNQHHSSLSKGYVRCYFEIYQMPSLPSGMSNEIL